MNNCLDWIASRKRLTRTHVASAEDCASFPPGGGCACRICALRGCLIFARAAVPAGSLRLVFVSNVPALS